MRNELQDIEIRKMAYGDFKEDDFLEGYKKFVQNHNEEILMNLNLKDEFPKRCIGRYLLQ